MERKAEPRCEVRVSDGHAYLRWFAPHEQFREIMQSFQQALGPHATLQGGMGWKLPLAVQPALAHWIDHTFEGRVECDEDELTAGIADFRQRYRDYLHSEAWEVVRQKVLDRERRAQQRDPPWCAGCWACPGTDVHHDTYKHVFSELIFELRLLCRRCHQRLTTEKEIA